MAKGVAMAQSSSRRKDEIYFSVREADNGWIANVTMYGSFASDDKTHVATSLDGAFDWIRERVKERDDKKKKKAA